MRAMPALFMSTVMKVSDYFGGHVIGWVLADGKA